MADFPVRYGDVDAPLPDDQEYSLTITFLRYQGRPTLSLEQKTRREGGKLRYKPLDQETLDRCPKNLRDALELLLNYTFQLANPVDSGDVEP